MKTKKQTKTLTAKELRQMLEHRFYSAMYAVEQEKDKLESKVLDALDFLLAEINMEEEKKSKAKTPKALKEHHRKLMLRYDYKHLIAPEVLGD